MAQCATGKHRYQLMAAGSKVWVHCQNCSSRFPFTHEYNGTPFVGEIPEHLR
jgi:hypothetical protein